MTLLCLLMLKMNLAGEWLGLSFYDNAIVTSNAAAAVLPIGLASALAIHRLACEFVDSRSDPLTKGDIVRVIACPEQIQCCGRLGKVTESDETDGLLVEVRIRNAEAPCLYAACRRSLDDVFQLRLQRAQVQIILGKKQTLKLVMGVVKQIFACAKAVRNRDQQDDKKKDEKKGGHHHHLQDVGHDIVTEVHVVDGLHGDDDEDINLKQMALDALRSSCEVTLTKHNLTWQQVENAVKAACSLSKIQDAIEDPEAFIKEILVTLSPLMKAAAIGKLRPKLEPTLAKHKISWQQAEAVLTTINLPQLQQMLESPEEFLQALLATAGPYATRLALGKLKPVILPLLSARGLQWEHALPAISLVAGSIEDVQKIIEDPERFVQNLLVATVGPIAKKMALAKLRPTLEPHIAKQGLAWADVMPALELMDSAQELEAAIDDPEAFLKQLLAAVGPVAKQLALAKLRPRVEPVLATRHACAWEDVLPVIEAVADVEHLEQALEDPEAFLAGVLATVGPVAKKMALAKLRPALEAPIAKHGLEWADVTPALELMDSVEELEAALDDPEAFVAGLLSAVGPVGKRLALAKLRPHVEPMLVAQHACAWKDMLPVIETAANLESLEQALDDPETFVASIVSMVGPIAKKMALAKLRPTLEPHIAKQGLAWADVMPALELMDSAQELEAAIDDPEAFLKQLLAAVGPVAKQLALAKLRPRVEPVLATRHACAWEDVLPVIEAVADVEHLEQALEDPEAFLAGVLATVGPVAKKMALAKLRPALEAPIAKHGLEWADVTPALELMDSVEELEAALDDPEAFVAGLLSAVGPVGQRIALAKLRPKLEPLLASRHAMSWEDALPALELVESIAELEAALEDPAALLLQITEFVDPAIIEGDEFSQMGF